MLMGKWQIILHIAQDIGVLRENFGKAKPEKKQQKSQTTFWGSYLAFKGLSIPFKVITVTIYFTTRGIPL